MNKKNCRDALDLYKKFLIRMDRVGEFLKVDLLTPLVALECRFLNITVFSENTEHSLRQRPLLQYSVNQHEKFLRKRFASCCWGILMNKSIKYSLLHI